jgi:hypothetical protein
MRVLIAIEGETCFREKSTNKAIALNCRRVLLGAIDRSGSTARK